MKFFKAKSSNLPTSPVEYPSGTFVKSEKGYFYVTKGKRYRIISKRLLDSWAPQRVVETTEAALSNYRISAKLKFRNGSLIHNIADGRIYLIVDSKRCWITSPEAFERIGAVREDTISVSLQEIELHSEGEPIN